MWKVRTNSISMERLDGETIVINFDSGEYFSFRGSSADILWLIDHGVRRDAWIDILRQAFGAVEVDADVESQIESFVSDLAAAGVVTMADGDEGPPIALPDDYARAEWTPPVVHGHDDLADLLLIDPIHDTSDDGWPQTRSE